MAFRERHLRTLAPVEIGGRHVKRYQITVDDARIPDDVQAAADEFTPVLLAEPDEETPPAAFIVVHQGSAVWLNAYSWVWDNVMHCRAAEASLAEPTKFTEMTKPWIGCVFELAPFAYERSAWVRHMLQDEQPDLARYLADALPDGPVGGP